MQNSLYYLQFLGILPKQCYLLKNMQFLKQKNLIQSWNLGEKSEYKHPTLFWGVEEGLGVCFYKQGTSNANL